MEVKQVQKQDVLTNLLIKSKEYIDQGIKIDHKFNYRKVYDNPKQLEVSYVDALANLEQINRLYQKRIKQKNIHYNFFLDNTENCSVDNPIAPELYQKYLTYLKNKKIFAYTLQNTWTKGKQFFFIKKGSVLTVDNLYNDRIFADVSYRGKIGLMKLQQLKIILSESTNIQQ